MPRVLRPKPDTRAVVEPQPAPLGLSRGHFQPFLPPDTLNALVVHSPPVPLQHVCDPSVAISAVLSRQADNALGQTFFRFRELRNVSMAACPGRRPGERD